MKYVAPNPDGKTEEEKKEVNIGDDIKKTPEEEAGIPYYQKEQWDKLVIKRNAIHDDFTNFDLGDDTYCNCFRALHRESRKTMRLTSRDA